MKRREFIALSGAALFAPTLILARTIDYSPGVLLPALDNGETVFLDFKASWCTTCAAQERVIDALKAENPAYEAQITFINVDWDDYGGSSLVQSLNIPRRSTLVVLNGRNELGRIVAGTSRTVIKDLMDTALTAASA